MDSKTDITKSTSIVSRSVYLYSLTLPSPERDLCIRLMQLAHGIRISLNQIDKLTSENETILSFAFIGSAYRALLNTPRFTSDIIDIHTTLHTLVNSLSVASAASSTQSVLHAVPADVDPATSAETLSTDTAEVIKQEENQKELTDASSVVDSSSLNHTSVASGADVPDSSAAESALENTAEAATITELPVSQANFELTEILVTSLKTDIHSLLANDTITQTEERGQVSTSLLNPQPLVANSRVLNASILTRYAISLMQICAFSYTYASSLPHNLPSSHALAPDTSDDLSSLKDLVLPAAISSPVVNRPFFTNGNHPVFSITEPCPFCNTPVPLTRLYLTPCPTNHPLSRCQHSLGLVTTPVCWSCPLCSSKSLLRPLTYETAALLHLAGTCWEEEEPGSNKGLSLDLSTEALHNSLPINQQQGGVNSASPLGAPQLPITNSLSPQLQQTSDIQWRQIIGRRPRCIYCGMRMIWKW